MVTYASGSPMNQLGSQGIKSPKKEEEEKSEHIELPQETKISRTLSDQTIKIVVIVILSLLFLLPLIDAETWIQPYLMQDFGMDMIVDIYDEQGDWDVYRRSVDVFIN
jgi:hypothetical protein